jgi:single-stranded-DNA-specific exonuclease
MRTWIEPRQAIKSPELEKAIGGHPLLTHVLVQRGLGEVEVAQSFIDPNFYQPTSPGELPDMGRAVDRISQAILKSELIGVWGDFDVDGQTATALLVSMMQNLGAQVTFHIPVRASESHGINLPELKRMLDKGVGLLLTCDTGIAEHEAVKYANGREVDVVITDHHVLPPNLPEAFAVLNPKILPEDNPLINLPGVGVAYKLVEALYQGAEQEGNADSCLDLVALGIVADVAIQSGDTRYLLQRGLEVLRKNQRLGLSIMMDLAELIPASITEEHIGFILAPRLNSIGRLGDANPIVEFLTTQDLSLARILAQELEALNARRKLLTDQVFQAAQLQIERDPSLLSQAALVLSHPSWPAGVIGIVAGRLAERYQRPVVLISAPEGNLARGSARSVEGCDINAAIAACQELLVGFGGHTMAAGFSLEARLIPDFRRALVATVRDEMSPAFAQPRLAIDGYFPLGELTMEFVEDLERLAPFGPGNPVLTLVSERLSLQQIRPVGRNEEHLQILVEDDQGKVSKVIWWQGAAWPIPEPLVNGNRFDLAYTVRTSNYRGQREIQIEWVDVRSSEGMTIEVKTNQSPLRVIDFRGEADKLNLLKNLLTESALQVWCDGEDRQVLADHGIRAYYRHELVTSQQLAVWTTPPGRIEWISAFQEVSPTDIYLFAVHPTSMQFDAFIRRLAGMCKYAINYSQGKVDIAQLASAMAQRMETVRLGVSWLEQSGFLVVVNQAGQEISLEKGKQRLINSPTYLADQINELLDETAAYRSFFTRTEVNALMPIDPENPTNQLRGATG